MDLEPLLRSVITWPVLGTAALTSALGAIGGAIYGWIQAGETSPSKGAAVGAIAALAVVYVAQPETALALIGGSLAAGYSGEAILKALQARAVVKMQSQQIDEQRAALAQAAHALQAQNDHETRTLGAALAAKYPTAPK